MNQRRHLVRPYCRTDDIRAFLFWGQGWDRKVAANQAALAIFDDHVPLRWTGSPFPEALSALPWRQKQTHILARACGADPAGWGLGLRADGDRVAWAAL